jgi:MFS family permease
MSTISAGRTAYRGRERAAQTSGWYSALGADGRRAFKAAFAGYTLDAFDLIVVTLSLTAIGATFDVGTGATGALSTVTLSASALGGILGGVLSDRIGRARTLMLTVYSLFTFLSGLATSYPMLMVFRVFQGIGFGGEWAVGAVLVAEMVRPESRGKALGVVQSAWAVGWAIAVLVYLLVFELFAETTAWRVLMCIGILPALLVLYVCRNVHDPEVYVEAPKRASPLKRIFRSDRLKATVFASILATGIQGGYYAMFTWIPTFLKKERDLTVVGTSGYLFVVIAGAFLGYSGFGSYLSELFPTHARGTGGGFCYNVGRGIGALFPGIIGFLAEAIGLGGAVAFGVFGYVLALMALMFLPETHGRELHAAE